MLTLLTILPGAPVEPQQASIFVLLLLLTATFVVGQLLRPKPQLEDAKPAGLGEFQFPTATEDRAIPLGWGTFLVKGPNVTWYGDLRQDAITEEVDTGLFSSEDVVVGFHYSVGVQFSLLRGPVDALTRVWIGDDLVFEGEVNHGESFTIDEPDLFGGDDLGNGGVVGTLEFFSGTTTQQPSGYLSSGEATSATVAAGGSGYTIGDVLTLVGGTGTPAEFTVSTTGGGGAVTGVSLNFPGSYSVPPTNPVSTTTDGSGTGCTLNVTFGGFQSINGHTPAYRGTCYLAPLAEPIYVGNSASLKPWKFELRRIPTGPADGGDELVNGFDANPVNVLYEAMTNEEWGGRIDATTIDTANFAAVGTVLKNEGNGFSMLLDSTMQLGDFFRLLEEQMDGVVFMNQSTGKWQIKLYRADYDPDDLDELTTANFRRVTNFSRGAWENTANHVSVSYNDREAEYKGTFAFAQDMANIQLQAGANIPAKLRYPGVKNRTLANQIAWRELRTVAFPLAKATIVVDRTFYAMTPGTVVLLTIPDKVTELPMRVLRIDLGDLENNEITLDLVQDIFYFLTGSFSDPGDGGWDSPADDLLPFDVDKQVAFESPRAFLARKDGKWVDRIWAGARRKGPEAAFRIVERHAPGSPSGPYSEAGESFQFFLIGNLAADLPAGSPIPLTTLLIDAAPDSQAALEAAFRDDLPVSQLGTDLNNFFLIDEEFLLASSAQTSGADVQLNGVYRGLCDTVQSNHLAGAKVYLLSVGGALTSKTLPAGDNVDVKLLPRSSSDTLDDADATEISFTMDDRLRRPYPPSTMRLDGVLWEDEVDLGITNHTDAEAADTAVEIRRRDFRLADTKANEAGALDVDADDLFGDYPAFNSSDHLLQVRNDPDGANILLFTETMSGATFDVLSLKVLRFTDGAIPARLRFVSRARHVYETVTYTARQDLLWDFDVTSALSGLFNFGALDSGEDSNNIVAPANGTYDFDLSSSFTTGNVEYRLNAGSWITLIAAGNTSGSIAGVIAGDVIEIRHLSSDTAALKLIYMNSPGSNTNGYGVLYT